MRIPRTRQNNPSFYRRPYGTGCATPAQRRDLRAPSCLVASHDELSLSKAASRVFRLHARLRTAPHRPAVHCLVPLSATRAPLPPASLPHPLLVRPMARLHLLACRWSGRAYSPHERVARHCPLWKSDATQQKLWRETDFLDDCSHTPRSSESSSSAFSSFSTLEAVLGLCLSFSLNPGSVSTSFQARPQSLPQPAPQLQFSLSLNLRLYLGLCLSLTPQLPPQHQPQS